MPVKTTTGKSLSDGVSRKRSNTSKPDMSGRPQIEHDAIEGLLLDGSECLRAGGDDRNVNVVISEQLPDTELLGGIVLHHQQSLAPRSGILL